ncbi:hypothetical protein OH76DRAFT_213376 [Lentinus brumalis]|uniref:Uncharacterized protein n=1 Tax=Lentinus brumalis TaxID=2498619 RepID=A0A371CML0_9APHY|nr:hypothetical protein OH76DRAFT_213376 [Polyporus brumalis]
MERSPSYARGRGGGCTYVYVAHTCVYLVLDSDPHLEGRLYPRSSSARVNLYHTTYKGRKGEAGMGKYRSDSSYICNTVRVPLGFVGRKT